MTVSASLCAEPLFWILVDLVSFSFKEEEKVSSVNSFMRVDMLIDFDAFLCVSAPLQIDLTTFGLVCK